MILPILSDTDLRTAAAKGIDAFLQTILDAIKSAAGGELNAETMQKLTPDQITLWAYDILHEEVMDGGFVQLIYNGYGSFFFDNPFAKALRLWGLHDFSKLIYKAKKFYDKYKGELTRERSDEEFMAMFEEYEIFDALDDEFIENEEEITALVASYVDEHLENFIEVKNK